MNELHTRKRMTDADRTNCLKLFECGLSVKEVADIMKVSTSAVSYVRQAHNACLEKDFDTLRKLSVGHGSTAAWAMNLTNTAFPEDVIAVKEPETAAYDANETKIIPDSVITREFMLATFEVVSDIRNLLTEIRDMLK